MAKRKGELSSSYIPNAINKQPIDTTGVQSTDHSFVNDERNTLTGILNGKNNELYTNLNKLSGTRTVVTYYQQVPSGENNSMVNMGGFNTSDPNLGKFIRIKDLSVKMDTVDVNFESTEGNGPKSVESEGKLIILPNTILPSPNDRFTMKYLDRVRLYRITDVNPLSGDSNSAYECPFICEDNDYNFENSELRKQVVEDSVFDEAYLGTNLRTVFRAAEYDTLQILKDLYDKIGKLYKREYWDDQLETFMLKYEDNLSEDNYQFNKPEYLVLSNDKCILPDKIKSGFEFKKAYGGRDMYDGELIDFILTNRIFDSINYYPLIPTQYATNIRTRKYNNTLFYSLEQRSRRYFKNRYILPIELNISNPDSQPVLYGKLSLMHVSSSSDLTLNLFPENLYDIVQNQVSEDIPITSVDKESVFDLIKYIVVLYINRLNKNLSQLIHVVDEKFEDLNSFYESVPSYQMFYLLPVLGFIMKKLADDIVNSNPSDNEISDPINTRRVGK